MVTWSYGFVLLNCQRRNGFIEQASGESEIGYVLRESVSSFTYIHPIRGSNVGF